MLNADRRVRGAAEQVPEQCVKIGLKALAQRGFQDAEEPPAVLVVDQAVVKHAQDFVRPQPQVFVARRAAGAAELAGLHHQEALHDAADVSQAERVVGPCWRRQQAGQHSLVHMQRRGHDAVAHLLDGRRERGLGQRPVEDGREDALQRAVVKVDDADHVEVARVARRDGVAAAAG
eukprot:352639-Chlamydomonas_euryale.AAC.3